MLTRRRTAAVAVCCFALAACHDRRAGGASIASTDSGPAVEPGRADAGDVSASDATLVPALSRDEVCIACISRRCSDEGAECWRDASCRAAYQCMMACTSPDCAAACTGGDSELAHRLSALGFCPTEQCLLACVARLDESGGRACVPVADLCDPLLAGYDSCCAGVCDEPAGRCCVPAGEPCDPSITTGIQCCGGGAMECDPTSARCVPRSCWETGCEPSLPCCDGRLQCVDRGALLGQWCCAVEGTVLPASEAIRCCESSIASNGDGTITCLRAPPTP